MAKGKKTGGKDFQRGHHIGRPQLPDGIKEVRKLTTATFTDISNELLYMTTEELQLRLKSTDTPVLELLVGKSIESAIATGNIQKIQIILDRLVQKQPMKTEEPTQEIIRIEMSRQDLIKIARGEKLD